MALKENPYPRGPRRMMIGGLREFIRGDISRQGLASRLEAVLEPPDKIINIGTRGENGNFLTVGSITPNHAACQPA